MIERPRILHQGETLAVKENERGDLANMTYYLADPQQVNLANALAIAGGLGLDVQAALKPVIARRIYENSLALIERHLRGDVTAQDLFTHHIGADAQTIEAIDPETSKRLLALYEAYRAFAEAKKPDETFVFPQMDELKGFLEQKVAQQGATPTIEDFLATIGVPEERYRTMQAVKALGSLKASNDTPDAVRVRYEKISDLRKLVRSGEGDAASLRATLTECMQSFSGTVTVEKGDFDDMRKIFSRVDPAFAAKIIAR